MLIKIFNKNKFIFMKNQKFMGFWFDVNFKELYKKIKGDE